MQDRESIYLRAPVPVQNILCTVQGWRNEKLRFGGQFEQMLAQYEARDTWSPADMAAFRDERIKLFVRHCVDHVPYYTDLFRRLDISPLEIRGLSDLELLPILSKAEVQANTERFRADSVASEELVPMHTSGTTGAGLQFVTTREAIRETYAAMWRYWRRHGIRQDAAVATFQGRSVVPLAQHKPPFWRHNLAGRQTLYSAYHMSPENLPAYVRQLRKAQTPWLHGYPSLLALLAAHIVDTGTDLGYKVSWISCCSESLRPHQADLIRRAFGVEPLQQYHMTESIAHVTACRTGKLHVDEDVAAVEFVPLEATGQYRVIGTNFTNPAFPLLRYDVQDNVTLSDEECRCGHPGRVVEDVDGRKEDYIVLANGACVGRMDHVFKDLVNVKEAQIHQSEPGEILVKIVKGSRFTLDDEQRLLAEMRRRVGTDMRITVEYVQAIPRTRTGKLRFVISTIPAHRLLKAAS